MGLTRWQSSASCCFLYIYIYVCVCVYIYIYIYIFFFFWAALGLCCRMQAFSSCGERGLLFVAVASLVAEHGL